MREINKNIKTIKIVSIPKIIDCKKIFWIFLLNNIEFHLFSLFLTKKI